METDVILKRFDAPDDVRAFELGRFELVMLGGMNRSGVVGERPYASLHFLGADTCAAHD